MSNFPTSEEFFGTPSAFGSSKQSIDTIRRNTTAHFPPTTTAQARPRIQVSPETINQAGQISNTAYNKAGQIIGGAPTPSTADLIKQITDASAKNADTNMSNLQKILGSIPGMMVSTAAQVNDQISKQTIANLDSMSPGWRDSQANANAAAGNAANVASVFIQNVLPRMAANLGQTGSALSKSANSLSAGILPADVIQQVRQSSAEKAVAGTGMSGGMTAGASGRNLMAKDLGLTSVNLMSQGAQLSGAANAAYSTSSSLYGVGSQLAAAPATAASAAANAYKNISPDLASGDSVLSSAAQMAGNAINATSLSPASIAQAVAESQKQSMEMDWTKRLSQANSAMSQGNTSLQMLFANLFGG